MAKLANRFYDPTLGRVLLDGIDIRTVSLQSLRSQLGVVPQEAFLFAGSIRTNLSFGRSGITTKEIEEAIDVVGLRDLIDRLPQGLDTVIHERGQTLSAGERQLLALARAFLARPRVLILDEATSSLDLQSETVIEAALDRLLEGRSAISLPTGSPPPSAPTASSSSTRAASSRWVRRTNFSTTMARTPRCTRRGWNQVGATRQRSAGRSTGSLEWRRERVRHGYGVADVSCTEPENPVPSGTFFFRYSGVLEKT